MHRPCLGFNVDKYHPVWSCTSGNWSQLLDVHLTCEDMAGGVLTSHLEVRPMVGWFSGHCDYRVSKK